LSFIKNYILISAEISLIKDEDVSTVFKEIDEHIKKECLESRPKRKRVWRTNEQAEKERKREKL